LCHLHLKWCNRNIYSNNDTTAICFSIGNLFTYDDETYVYLWNAFHSRKMSLVGFFINRIEYWYARQFMNLINKLSTLLQQRIYRNNADQNLKNIIQILCTCEVKLIRRNTKCNANTWRSEFILSHKSLHILFNKSYFITKQVLLKLLWIKSLNKIYFYYVCEMMNNDIKNCKLKKSIHIWHTKACVDFFTERNFCFHFTR